MPSAGVWVLASRVDANEALARPSRQLKRSHAAGRRTLDLGRLPHLALLAAIGFGITMAAYAGARTGASWSLPCYWLGEATMFLPLVGRVIVHRGLRRNEALGLVVVGALLQYLVRYAYSPLGFSFSDELSHWQTTREILQTHHLFGVNYVLPISPRYPGLEIVTAAVSSLSGASIFISGVIVVGAAHLLLIVTLYALLWCASGSSRIAALAALIYETNPHYQFFDSYFVYQNLAVPLLLVVILTVAADGGMLADRLSGGQPRAGQRAALRIFGMLIVATVVITHHVTIVALISALAVLAIFHAVSRRRLHRVLSPPTGPSWPISVLTVLTAGLASIWVLLVATQTIRYLSPTVTEVASGVSGLFGEGSTTSPAAGLFTPVPDEVLTYALSAVVVLALPFGVWWTLRARRSRLALFLAGLSLSYYVLIVLRLVSADGAELAGRAFTYVYVPVSFTLAVAAIKVRNTRLPPLVSSAPLLIGVAVLFFGGLVSGWPPYWERLPGGYQVSGLERSLSPPDRAVAQWFGDQMPPGGRVAVDLADYPLVGTIGQQDVIRNGGQLFYSSSLNTADEAFVRRASVRYIVIDKRLSTAFPASGRYFPDDPRAYQHATRLNISSLTKFDHIPGVSRLYDNGDIQVYDLTGSPYLP